MLPRHPSLSLFSFRLKALSHFHLTGHRVYVCLYVRRPWLETHFREDVFEMCFPLVFPTPIKQVWDSNCSTAEYSRFGFSCSFTVTFPHVDIKLN